LSSNANKEPFSEKRTNSHCHHGMTFNMGKLSSQATLNLSTKFTYPTPWIRRLASAPDTRY